jgi:hypothetical protein
LLENIWALFSLRRVERCLVLFLSTVSLGLDSVDSSPWRVYSGFRRCSLTPSRTQYILPFVFHTFFPSSHVQSTTQKIKGKDDHTLQVVFCYYDEMLEIEYQVGWLHQIRLYRGPC